MNDFYWMTSMEKAFIRAGKIGPAFCSYAHRTGCSLLHAFHMVRAYREGWIDGKNKRRLK